MDIRVLLDDFLDASDYRMGFMLVSLFFLILLLTLNGPYQVQGAAG